MPKPVHDLTWANNFVTQVTQLKLTEEEMAAIAPQMAEACGIFEDHYISVTTPEERKADLERVLLKLGLPLPK